MSHKSTYLMRASSGRINEALFQMGKVRRERVNAQKTAVAFMSRLGNLCFDLQNLGNGVRLGRLSDIAKECGLLSQMYTHDDAFIPEVSYEKGYNAASDFESDPLNREGFDFPDMLDRMAELLEGADTIGDVEGKDLSDLTRYHRLLKKFAYTFYADYGLADADTGNRLAMKKDWIDWMPDWGTGF